MQRKHGAWDAGKRITCTYVSGTQQLLLTCRRSGGRTFLRLCRRNTAGACPRRRAPWGHAVRPIPRGRPESTPPHDPKKEPTKVRPEEHKNRPLHACRSLNFFDREITSSALPGRSYGYKRPAGLPEPGYIPRAGPASSTSPWYRADSCGVHPPAPEYPAAAQWPDWPRR